ncbi:MULTISPECIES: DUF305 domain-containing protein [unclassified Streptomyces]|uniref:DUF305 domain-containing protein n=1 Tax=unclassified Streptomyces TaxID=2593676 RepID=UPI0006AE80BD|nr:MULTISPECIES: DUF305 domain-containing protein [unclassified Streptomyces]KOX22740.1 hypothetical protein ADL06_23975 [Streptomyces sp. NRRL F-6491]KOX39662.1 hypothetical protein ADL08_25035 [Streptomyces sp. NRRL F-6492]
MRAFTHRATRVSALVGAAAATGLLLTACGADDTAPSASVPPSATAAAPGAAASPAPAPGPFNDADVMFAQMMIPHHEQALEMAELADGRAEDPGVKRLVAAIERAQGPEIRTMRAWLAGWGRPGSAGHGGGHGSGHGMAGMMSEQDMKDLAAAGGEEFDRTFAELMIAHHEGAVAMAEDERKNGLNPTARKLADDVVRTQSAEVAELRKVLDRL